MSAPTTINAAAVFYPAAAGAEPGDQPTSPAVEVAGVMVCLSVTRDQRIRVSIDLDNTDEAYLVDGLVPLDVWINGESVFGDCGEAS